MELHTVPELLSPPFETIETDRLYLRKFCQDDAEEMFTTWAFDEDVTRYMTWAPHPNVEETQRVIKLWEDAYAQESWGERNFAIVVKQTGKLIGSIGLVRFPRSCSCEIGYCVGKPYWGNGYVTEAARALVDYCFTKLHAMSVHSTHHPDNPASGRIMQKCGMTHTGLFRRHIFLPAQGLADQVLYSILKEEWEALNN